ncbi:MAG TPA: hypothetical protein VF838_14160 [Trebonia sp.]
MTQNPMQGTDLLPGEAPQAGRRAVHSRVPGVDRPHATRVIEGSAYRAGPGNCTGSPADLRNAWHYPVEAVCGACSQVLHRASVDDDWEHTGRIAGHDPLPGDAHGQLPV